MKPSCKPAELDGDELLEVLLLIKPGISESDGAISQGVPMKEGMCSDLQPGVSKSVVKQDPAFACM